MLWMNIIMNEIKYLGVYIVSNLTDDLEMGKRVRSIYAVGNMIISKFRICNASCKELMFKTYCYNIYGIALWSSFRISSFVKVKVAHNDIFRTLFNVPRYESASNLFVEHSVNNLDAIRRTAMFSLMDRLLSSRNRIIECLCNSEVRIHSNLWKCWAVALGVQWEHILLM